MTQNETQTDQHGNVDPREQKRVVTEETVTPAQPTETVTETTETHETSEKTETRPDDN